MNGKHRTRFIFVIGLVALLAGPAATPVNAADVILNEYNAVGGSDLLGGENGDVFWANRKGNGDDWFELVVITDNLDMRGWQIKVVNDKDGLDEASWLMTLSDHNVWSSVESGTIVTVSELLGNNADEYEPSIGNWWLNVRAAAGGAGTYISVECLEPVCDPSVVNWNVSNTSSQVTIMDDLGAVVFGPAGEGVAPISGVGATNVFKLEEDPSASTTPNSGYNNGSSSTFGAPNVFSGGSFVQDFSALRGVDSYSALTTVRINEVLTHSDPGTDWVELYNATEDPIDIGGWFLADGFGNLTDFTIPSPTVVPGGGFVVFDQSELGFGFSSPCGDELVLSQGDGVSPTGPRDFVRLGAADSGVSIGRSPNGFGPFGRLETTTMGFANTEHELGPLIISEIMYHPPTPLSAPTFNPEFIELHNITSSPVNLFTDYGADGVQPWKISGGSDFKFPTGTTIGANGYLLVVNFDPVAASDDLALFRSIYSLASSVAVVGPYGGNLSNLTSAVRLRFPDTPEANPDTCGPTSKPGPFVPYVTLEELRYSDFGAWPSSADGSGPSLERIDGGSANTGAENWAANVTNTATPGSANSTQDGLSSNQQRCLSSMAKSFGRMVKTKGRANSGCLKSGIKGSLAPGAIDDCVLEDVAGKTALMRTKTEASFAKICSGFTAKEEPLTPFFGLASASTLVDAAILEEVLLFGDSFGAPLEDTVIRKSVNAAGALCQQSVAKRMTKCEDTLLKEFSLCIKNGLRDQTITTASAFAACQQVDLRGKVASACDATTGRVRREISNRCTGGVALEVALPGCESTDEATVAECVESSVRCRACQALNSAFRLDGDCDRIDNGSVDASCGGL